MLLQNMQSDNPRLSQLGHDVYDLRLTINHVSKELPSLLEVGQLIDITLLDLWEKHHRGIE